MMLLPDIRSFLNGQPKSVEKRRFLDGKTDASKNAILS